MFLKTCNQGRQGDRKKMHTNADSSIFIKARIVRYGIKTVLDLLCKFAIFMHLSTSSTLPDLMICFYLF